MVRGINVYKDEEHKELNIQGLGNRMKATIIEIHANTEIKNKVAFMLWWAFVESKILWKCKKKTEFFFSAI